MNFIEFQKEKVLHLRQILSRQYPILGAGWLENRFAESDVKVLRSKQNMLSFLKVGKRSHNNTGNHYQKNSQQLKGIVSKENPFRQNQKFTL